MLREEPSNSARNQLLLDIKTWPSIYSHQQHLSWLAEQRKIFFNSLKAGTVEEIQLYVHLAMEYGGLKFLEETLCPQLGTSSSAEFLVAFARYLFENQAHLIRPNESNEILKRLVTGFLSQAIARADYYASIKGAQRLPARPVYHWTAPKEPEVPKGPPLYEVHIAACQNMGNPALLSAIIQKMIQDINSTDLELRITVVTVFEICYRTSNEALCADVLQKITEPNLLQDKNYLEEKLRPLLEYIKHFLDKRRIPVTTEPYASAFKMVLCRWITDVLGAKPRGNYMTVTSITPENFCRCDTCRQVINFFHSTEGRIPLFRIGAPTRKHVEGKLAMHASKYASWTMIQSTPQGLEVTKNKSLSKLHCWNTLQIAGANSLKGISTKEDQLRVIFGDQYGMVMKQLFNVNIAPAPAPARPSTSNATSTAANRAVSQPIPPMNIVGEPVPRKRVLSTMGGEGSVSRPLDAGVTSKRQKVVTNANGIETIDLT